jgi:integrase
VAAGKTAREEAGGKRGPRVVRGGEGAATRTLGMLGAMLEFAVARGMRPDNPVKGVRRAPHKERDRVLSEAETARLGEALAAAEADGEPWQAVGLVRLLLLTGLRRDEARGLRWEHVDLGGGRLLLPDTKTGRSARPLASPAVALLAGLRERSGAGPWVFPAARGPGHFVGLQKAWVRIRARAGLADVRLHDLRHNLASVAVASGESLYVTGKVLGHRKARSTERYAHLADDPIRAAADRAAGRIAAALTLKAGEAVGGGELAALPVRSRRR